MVGIAGDTNADCAPDIVLGAPGWRGSSGAAWVLGTGASGGSDCHDPRPADPPLAHATIALHAAGSSMFGESGDGAGDVDGDGFGDLIVGAMGSGTAHLYILP